MGIQYENTKNSIKPKNYPKSKALRVLNGLDIDWLVAFYKAECIAQWADEHIRKDVCRLNSTGGTQIESSQTN